MTADPSVLRPGDFYEDCSFHAVLCTEVTDAAIRGISLIDGSTPRECCFGRCDIMRLNIDEVIAVKADWYGHVAKRLADRLRQ